MIDRLTIGEKMSDEINESINKFFRERTLFFAEAGQCIIEYQKLEDSLEGIFLSALGGPERRAAKIFSVARGLEAKLDIVTAACYDLSEPLMAQWNELKKRVTQAAINRNQIAHSRPVSTSDPIILTPSTTPGRPGTVSGGANSRTEIWKKTKAGDAKWTRELLHNEYLKNHNLFGAIIAFVMQIRCEEVPHHLIGI